LASEANVPLERVHVVYDGVDLSRHAAPGMLDGLRDRVWHRPLVIGGAGLAENGRALFFATATRIAARHPDAHFVWLEDRDEQNDRGEGRGRLADQPAGLSVTTVPVADDLGPVLSQLAMLCLTGGPESPSLDLVAATMAAARPVVAVDVPGIDELVADGATGAVVPPGDPAALADAAIALLEDRGRLRAAGHAARAYAERALCAERMARATAALYEASLLGRPAPGSALAVAPVSSPADGWP
jgi:glycosyltransferase involved in cell wall biosynthesis